MLLTAPQDETVSPIAGASVRLHETHDAFARQNCAENRCIWLAMVSSVSPETEHTPAKVMTVSRELPAIPVGGDGARLWCPWAAAGPGRASKRHTEPHISNQAPLVWRALEGPEGPAAVPVGGSGSWPGHPAPGTPVGLQAAPSMGRAATHRHTQRQGPTKQHNGAPGTPAAPQATQRQAPHQRTQAHKKPTSGSDVGLWWS